MHIQTLEGRHTRGEILCEGFLITAIDSFEQLLRLHAQYAIANPGHSVLMSLDDLGQAQYTSAHAVLFHELDDTDGHDLSGVDASVFEDGEHIGYLSTRSEFFIREENFKRRARGVTFDDACQRGLQLDDDQFEVLERIHAAPELVLDDAVIAWIVPVRDSALALCANPNGYFTSDLNPFENHALARHLQDEYGYTLFGIGASCIGFQRASPLGAELAQRLVADLARLYNCPTGEETAGRLLKIVEDRAILILKYTENLDIG